MRSSSASPLEAAVTSRVPRWVRLADATALLMAAIALVLLVGDGIRLDLGVVRLSIRSALRAGVWAMVVVVLRHVLYVTPALHTRVIVGLRALSWRRDLPRSPACSRRRASPRS